MRATPVVVALALALGTTPARPAAKEDAPAPTGLARFTNHDRFVEAKLSPNGKYLSAIALRDGRRSLAVVELATGNVTTTIDPSDGAVAGKVHWVSEERLLVELVDQDGTLAAPISRGEIYALNADGTGRKFIFGYRAGEVQTGTHIRRAEQENAWGEVVDTLRHDDRHVLIASRAMDEVGDRQVRLWKLDVFTGVKVQVAMSPMAEAEFFTDEEGELRLAVAMDAKVKRHWFLRDPAAKAGWRELTGQAGFTANSHPEAFVAKDQAIELWEPLGSGFALYRVKVETGARTLLAKMAVARPSRYLRARGGGRALAYAWSPDLPNWEVLDGTHPLARALDGLLSASSGQDVRIVDSTEDGRLALAYVYGDRQPGRWLLLDVAKGTAEPVLEARPWIDPGQMAEIQAFHIAASDGFRIHGYLTLPRGLPPGVKPPLVILPHGGPHFERDTWGFDWEAQLLAAEGFAVLQVNYRGSGGYGTAYQEAGYLHWGDRIIEDILDGARWAIQRGKVDGGRVCAYGASFGAYAAMQAASLAPDLVRCAAGLAGVYDLTAMESTGDISWRATGRGYVRTVIGADEVALKSASPAHHPERLTVPVFLAHGGRDKRAPIEHAEKLRDALTAQGRPPEWLVEQTEGHGFYDQEARVRLYGRLVAFLKRNTAPKGEGQATR